MAKDSCRDGKWLRQSVFLYTKLDEDGGLVVFQTDQDKVTPPTLMLDLYRSHPTMKSGIIHRINYRLNPTNALATFTLRIWEASVADPYNLNLNLLYESPPLQADDIDYDRTQLDIPFILTTPGWIFYSIDWVGVPGVTPGFIRVSGEKVE